MQHGKVVFVNRFFYPDHSATSQILTELAFDLAEAGIRVEVVTSRLCYDDPAKQLPAQEEVRGIRVHRLWSTRFGRGKLLGKAIDFLTFQLSVGLALLRLLNANSVVVIETDPPLLTLVATPAARLRKAIVVNWVHDLFPEVASALHIGVRAGPAFKLLRWARNVCFRSAATNVVLGSRMAAAVISQGIPATAVRIIHNWADGAAIAPVAPPTGLRAAWGLEGKFVVGYSGNLGRAHDMETVLVAAEILAGRPDIAFLFIGGGARLEDAKGRVRARRLGNVLFRPYQPRESLSESLGTADVHLVSLAPNLEGCIVPSKFYGIAAAARPTLFVGDSDGEIARLLQEAQCGYSVDVGDSARLAQLVVQLAGDQALCSAMGERARKLFESRFERRHATSAWRELLETHLGRAGVLDGNSAVSESLSRD